MQNDLISRSALLKEFEKRQEQQTNEYCDCFLDDAQELSTEWWCVEDAVQAAPTIDAVPVVHGRWVMMAGFPACSKCGCSPADWEAKPDNPEGYPPYCHSCGAKMGGHNDTD